MEEGDREMSLHISQKINLFMVERFGPEDEEEDNEER